MNLKGLDLLHLTKLTSLQVDHVTCLECCKYFIAPETAACGHTLCHICWRGRRTCPACAAPLEKQNLKLNMQVQNLTEHVYTLAESFEKLFNIKLDEFVLDETGNEVQCETDPTKNVKDWLASSQNQFSAPVINSEPFSQDIISNPVELSTSKIQVHMNSKKSTSPKKVVYVPPPQDDWDKIEQLPDTEDVCANNKENITDQTNKQPYILVDDEYTSNNPRRSSRKREYNSQNELNTKNRDTVSDKPSSKHSSSETEKKSSKAKQNWNNVKRMRKEFSKLNKKNRSKLNVSIEMCKKTQSTTNKPNIDTEIEKNIKKASQPATYTIEDNTPAINIDDDNRLINELELAPNNAVHNKLDDVAMKSPNVTPEKVASVNNGIENSIHMNGNNGISDNVPLKETPSKNITSNNLIISNNTIPVTKKMDLCASCAEKNQGFDLNKQSTTAVSNLDDIEITLKIGNTLTNITIKRKNNDVQVQVKADREVQTSLGPNNLINLNNNNNLDNINPKEININIDTNNSVTTTKNENEIIITNTGNKTLNKSVSTKKNTASADTATAQFEITESVEKELSNIMECVGTAKGENGNKDNIQSQEKIQNLEDEDCEDYINDVDIFDNESVQEQHVQILNKSKHAPSEILMHTVKTKSQKHPDKRDRDINDDSEVPNPKKVKIVQVNPGNVEKNNSMVQPSPKENDSINYDVVMGQVFASIDADIEKSQKSNIKQTNNNKSQMDMKKTQNSQNVIIQSQINTQAFPLSTRNVNNANLRESLNEKYSENVFSVLTKDDETDNNAKKGNDDGSTQRHIENLLTPGMCQDLISTNEENNMELMNKEHCTPFHVQDDDDKSVVEETPQKNISFPKPKSVNDANVSNQVHRVNSKVASNSQLLKSIINVSDTLEDSTKTSKDQTVLETVAKTKALETPLTINKFVDQIKHKSTPMARKSLNFDAENTEDIDPEQTLCPSSVVAKTTQEKEFMTKAFEQTPKSPVKMPLMTKNTKEVELKYCIAGSCLSAVELTNVKYLCRKYNWKYVDKYTRELTHLVVGVDEEKRSQRSVKYMCALAASKWIVSYEWVDACLSTNLVVGESLYEALDGTGEPGPKRSRLAKTKLFQGITFYCMPPFSVLDVDALKEMLEASGGRVVSEVKAARATSDAPALLLAEPEHTQEDRFMYLALELNIVPVNYEWVLNCLGSYTLSSIQELLMCPATLLPPATNNWPEVLIARDSY